MCGITGWVDFARDLRQELRTLEAMTQTLARRGPDQHGTWSEHHVALGHRRLSVIDLEGGVQPMKVEREGRVLAATTFCGEIYNFRELRQELRALGGQFRTNSDTEVLLEGYLQWGAGLVDRLNGMYAFGIWDLRSEELLLVRDRMGVKPLFYYPTPSGLIFGSEPKALLANPLVRRRVSMDGMRELLDMVKTPEVSIYDGMSELRPGSLLRFSRRGLAKSRYWQLQALPHRDGLRETVQTVRDLLEDTVRHQTVADVPVCSLLSGGLDSSAVTALAARDWPAGRFQSFSVDFQNNMDRFEVDAVRSSPDAPFARALAAHAGTDHTEILLHSERLLDPQVRAEVLTAADGPPMFWGDMWPSLYLLFKEIRQHHVVALSGEAADELFGGYRWFHNPAAVQAETFPWLTSGSARYFGGMRLLAPELLDRLDIPGYRQARYNDALAEVPSCAEDSDVDRQMRRITYLNLTRFVQTLLDRKDRMSMAASLEVRVPFCDHRLVQYVFNVPWNMKCQDGREKSLLRAAVADLLPASVLEREKTPYPATQDPRYEEGLRRELAEVLADPASPALPLLDVAKAKAQLARPTLDVSQPYNRGSLEVALGLNRWMREYQVDLAL